MTKVKYDIWRSENDLASLCMSGELREKSISSLEPNSKIVHSYYAESHFDAMTKYYRFMKWGVYETEFEIDKESFNLEKIMTRAKKWKEIKPIQN